MKVLEAIKALLAHKGECTYSEIAKVSRCSSINVLHVLNNNKSLLKLKKNKIVGLVNTGHIQRESAYKEGKTYKISKENYGADTVIDTLNTKCDDLKSRVYYGGFGDSYPVDRIEATKANIAEVKRRGLVEYSAYEVERFSKFWNEP